MSSSVDRILDLLDGTGQTSDEDGYGDDWNPDLCARCQRHDPVDDGELCPGCRAFLLEDSDDDPRRPARPEAGFAAFVYSELEVRFLGRLLEGDGQDQELRGISCDFVIFDELVATIGTGFTQVADAIAEAFRPIADTLAELAASITVIDWDEMKRQVDEVLASRPARRPGPTLTRGALAPPRDLRATEAPRRRPMLYRRRP